MFNPTEIIFAVTTSCNLHCKHCFINRNPASLKAEDAVKFLKTVHESSSSEVEKIGFSGGEPFLCVDFLEKIIKISVEYDFMFDRIMTNGDWWKTKEDLQSVLQKIYDAGYDGKIGLSYDSFHNQSEERIITFIQSVWKIFGSDSLEIQSVCNQCDKPHGCGKEIVDCENSEGILVATGCRKIQSVCNQCDKPHGDCLKLLKSLSQKLNLSYEENISKSGRGIVTLTGENVFLPAYIQTESYQSSDERAFKDKTWFKEDYCESMGQILFIHAAGDIAPCCGFANENKELFIGKITDTFDTVLEKARENEMILLCYENGLSSEIKTLQKEGKLPAGKTEDICTFCDFVCRLHREKSI